MKYYIANDLGCVYRLKYGHLEYADLLPDGTFDTEDFAYVEPDLVGDERVLFNGVDTDLYGVYATVERLLSGEEDPETKVWTDNEIKDMKFADEADDFDQDR